MDLPMMKYHNYVIFFQVLKDLGYSRMEAHQMIDSESREDVEELRLASAEAYQERGNPFSKESWVMDPTSLDGD
jgi:hypothetical protein